MGKLLGVQVPPLAFAIENVVKEIKLSAKIKDLKSCEKLITVKVNKLQIQNEYEKVYLDIGKNAKVPGFRQGKIPVAILKNHYQDEAKGKVLQNLIAASLDQVFTENKIEPITRPEIRDYDFTEEQLKFDAYVEIRPEIKMGEYAGIKIKKLPVIVDEKEIDEAIERLRKGYAKFTPVTDRGLQLGDVFIADLTVTSGEKEVENAKDEWFEFETERLLPEVIKELAGVKTQQQKTIEVKFPKTDSREDLAGKKGVFAFDVKEIKKAELPELTEAWLKEIGDFKTVADLRGAVKTDLERAKENSEKKRQENEILEKLVSSAKFEIPTGLLSAASERLYSESKRNSMMRGIKEDEIEKQKSEVIKKLTPEAEKQVRLGFIFDEIAVKENVEVSAKEIEIKLEEVARQIHQPLAKVLEYYREKNQISSLAHQILNEKIIQLLVEKAEISA